VVLIKLNKKLKKSKFVWYKNLIVLFVLLF
jgi:hypothetical protein